MIQKAIEVRYVDGHFEIVGNDGEYRAAGITFCSIIRGGTSRQQEQVRFVPPSPGTGLLILVKDSSGFDVDRITRMPRADSPEGAGK